MKYSGKSGKNPPRIVAKAAFGWFGLAKTAAANITWVGVFMALLPWSFE